MLGKNSRTEEKDGMRKRRGAGRGGGGGGGGGGVVMERDR